MRFSRNRLRHDQHSYVIGEWQYRRIDNNALLATFPAETVTTWSKGDSFTDTTGGSDDRDDVYPCDRVSLSVVDNYRIPFVYGTGNAYEIGEPFPTTVPFEEFLQTHDFCPLPPSSFTTQMGDNAFEAMSTQVPQEVSLPNFLYELRDVAALLPKLEEGMVKTVAGGHLNYQFGWKPFIGDIQKLRNLSTTIADRLAYLRATYGRETRLSYSREFTHEDCDITIPDSPANGFSLRSYKGTFRSGGYLYHELKGLYGLEAQWRAAAGALGLNNPLGVIWEAIPFSFVVDWFSRVGNALSRTAVQPFEGLWVTRRVTHSYRIESVYEKWINSAPAQVTSPTFPRLWTRYKCTRYFRAVGIPASSTWLTSTGLTSGQQGLAAALIGASSR